jgi:two-component system phosphate regulon sensor histidine kinase PhoR
VLFRSTVIAAGGGGTLLFGGDWRTLLVSIATGLLAMVILVDREPPATAASLAEPVHGPPDLLDSPEFDRLLEGIAEPMLICERGRVVRANRSALRVLGAHIVGEDVRIAIRHPAAAERLANLAPMAEPVTIELVGLGTRDQRWQMQIAPLGGGDHADRRVVHLIDRSGPHAAEKMRVDFVANASHELRTPLAAILGFIETLTDPKAGADQETRDRFLKIMDGEARRMQQLVDDLMSLSRIEAEKYRLPDTAVDMEELVTEVSDIFRQRPRGGDIVVSVDALISPVQGERTQLSQVLHNLIGNSVKYGRPGTPITVSLTRATPHMVRLTVADEGEGIAPDHLPRLTERFYRVDSGRSRAMGGTGLGLAIVKHVVERHRGRLDISSVLGKGTIVTILLPIAEADAAQPA